MTESYCVPDLRCAEVTVIVVPIIMPTFLVNVEYYVTNYDIIMFTVNTFSTILSSRPLHMCCTLKLSLYTLQFRFIS